MSPLPVKLPPELIRLNPDDPTRTFQGPKVMGLLAQGYTLGFMFSFEEAPGAITAVLVMAPPQQGQQPLLRSADEEKTDPDVELERHPKQREQWALMVGGWLLAAGLLLMMILLMIAVKHG